MTVKPSTPRNVVKEAYKSGLIDDGQVWIDMIDRCNMLSRTYDFKKFKKILVVLEERYKGAFASLHRKLSSEGEK